MIIPTRDESPLVYHALDVSEDSNFDLSTALFHVTVVPATAGHRWFRGKVALRGRWPLVTGNGHNFLLCAIMSNQTHTSDSIYFTAHAQHYEAQRSITMLYRPTVRDETNNAENL